MHRDPSKIFVSKILIESDAPVLNVLKIDQAPVNFAKIFMSIAALTKAGNTYRTINYIFQYFDNETMD